VTGEQVAGAAMTVLGGAYLAVCAVVIAVAAISDRWGRDHDRRGGGST
jgi:hypothetical protein